ncbi:MAG TPA: M15 family metallopeptidase [Syntrophorhabdaceae bacterium]|nr:M15 family metallopeptidase [Syntrophorhabdaceae bacterium]
MKGMKMSISDKITALKPNTGWREVAIEECGDPLVSINKEYLTHQIRVMPQYYHQGIENAKAELFAREGVVARLIRVSQKLPDGYKLLIWDAWRPLEVQEALYRKFEAQVKLENPTASPEKIAELTSKFVSLPSNNPHKPSPHFTGGSIDLTIADSSGIPLNMGTEFDDFSEKAATSYFEDNDISSEVQRNRRVLYNLMLSEGFTNYNEEWWHFDYGNQFWGVIKGAKAIYGVPKL